MARALGDSWRLSQILSRQAYGAFMVGDLLASEPSPAEGRDLADAIGDQFQRTAVPVGPDQRAKSSR